MSNLLFRSARLIDPSTSRDEIGDLYISDGKITSVPSRLPSDTPTIDCTNKVLCPGLIDMRCFGGEPGGEHRETIRTLSLAASAGGITGVLMMPDTDPVIDDVALIEFVLRTSREESRIHIYPCAAITKGLLGERLTEIGLLQRAGAVAFSDGRCTISNNRIQKRALTYARDFNALIIASTQDSSLSGSGVMNSGETATRMGLSGIPIESELIPLERDMRLVSMTNGCYHASVLSTATSIDIVRRAKSDGLDITCGVSITNLTLNDNDIGSYRTFYRLSPPLRSESDRLGLIEGIRDGTIDVICSNHDPQDADTKRHPFADAADGSVGVETLLSASLRLYHNHDISLLRLIDCLSTSPARRLGIPGGTLSVGSPADLTLFDLDEPWVVEESDLHSKSKNTSFEQAQFQGRVHRTYVDGECVFNLQQKG